MAHVPVFRTSEVSELVIVKSVLDAEGISYVVQGEEALTLLPVSALWGGLGNSGVAAVIEVPEEEAEEARKVLHSAQRES
jgi:hypothetical protein